MAKEPKKKQKAPAWLKDLGAKGSAGKGPPKWWQYRPPFKPKDILIETGKKVRIRNAKP